MRLLGFFEARLSDGSVGRLWPAGTWSHTVCMYSASKPPCFPSSVLSIPCRSSAKAHRGQGFVWVSIPCAWVLWTAFEPGWTGVSTWAVSLAATCWRWFPAGDWDLRWWRVGCGQGSGAFGWWHCGRGHWGWFLLQRVQRAPRQIGLPPTP